MRGVDPETWWRYHRRTEAGELWIGPSASARRVQRLVQASRSAVLALAVRRDEDLRGLASARCSAVAELRDATVEVVTALGAGRVATVLGIPPAMVRALCRQEQPPALLHGLSPPRGARLGTEMSGPKRLNTVTSPAEPP